jgi:peptidoglycan hydrolase-like protein with peptidoglycan-binding domain
VAAGALVLVVLAVVAAVVLGSGGSPKRGSDTGVPAGDTTATVTRRTLSESATVNGTLGYGGERELYDRLAGTFTWLPAVGAQIGRGGTLFRLDDLPVVLMYGTVPAYRTLKQGVSKGPDVTELNANLIDLGYDPYGAISDEESFGEATAAAVRRWQKAEGLTETGEVELGRIVFAPSAQRVTALHVALGQDPPGAGSSEPSAGQPGSGSPSSGQPPSGEGTPSSEKGEPSAGKGAPSGTKSPSNGKGKPSGGKSPSKPSGEKSPSKPSSGKSPSKPSSQEEGEAPSSKGGEQAAGGGEAVLSSTSTQQIVQLEVKPEQQQLAHAGEHVQVLLPGGGTAGGRIASVGTVASSPSGGGGAEGKGAGSGEPAESTIGITVTLDRPVAHLDEAPVSVELVKSIRHDVLTVPATALIGTAGGGYAIEALEGGHRRPVPVTPGMFAGGYVQVEGPGVREGMTVVESE